MNHASCKVLAPPHLPLLSDSGVVRIAVTTRQTRKCRQIFSHIEPSRDILAMSSLYYGVVLLLICISHAFSLQGLQQVILAEHSPADEVVAA